LEYRPGEHGPHSKTESVAKRFALSHNYPSKTHTYQPGPQREFAVYKKLFTTFAITLSIGGAAAWPIDGDKDKPAAGVGKLPQNWGDYVTDKDLTDEISESATRMGQNLKKPSDFDKFLKNINTEGHLTAVLAALVQEHPDTGNWKGVAASVQTEALSIAKAAEAKGGKNFRTAADAHKKITGLLKKGAAGDEAGTPNGSPDWASLGALADVMKRVEPHYKYIRGKMSSETAFTKESETIRHNAAMLYIYGHIAPAFRPAEGDMPKLSGAMSIAATELLDAVKASDFVKAGDANTAINTSCNECHKAKRFTKKGSDFDF
jgi:hypothetical protein